MWKYNKTDNLFLSSDELYHYGVPGMRWGKGRMGPKIPSSKIYARRQALKSNVYKYSKAADKVTNQYDKADENNRKVKELYKKTGKNAISRVINNIIGKSSAVKEYSKAADKVTNQYDKADENNRKVKELYKKTGKNSISRVINNIKYSKGR